MISSTQDACQTHNGVTALHQAVSALRPDITYPRLMATCGGTARVVACGLDCLCAEERAATEWLQAARVPGLSLTWLDGADVRPAVLQRRITTAARAGRPVAWFRREEEGVVVGVSDTPGRVYASATRWDAAPEVGERSVDDLRQCLLCFPSRSRVPLGLRRDRERELLVEWVAEARRPPVPGACRSQASPAVGAVGLAAFGVWAASLDRPARERPRERPALAVRALWWLDAYQAASAFLADTAGALRDPYHVRLRRAAGTAEAVVRDTLQPLASLMRPARSVDGSALRQAARLLRQGLQAAEELVGWIAEAAWLAGPPDPGLREVLLSSPGEPLAGTALQEVIYLARAGTRPFRQLAALRLAGSDAPPARAALRQLLYDADGPVSECALWSLTQTAPDAFGLYSDAFGSVGRERARTDLPLQIPLLHAALATHHSGASALLSEAVHDEDAAVRAWAERLTAASPSSP